MQKATSCFIVWAICCLFSFFQLNGQSFLTVDGQEIVDADGNPHLLRGMGLGGWMLQEGYMLQTAEFANAQFKIREKISELIGEDATQEFYDAWLANHCTREDIDSLASWGFNSVRLPMHYNLFTLPIEDEPVAGQQTWLETGFELTDALIEWCRANEMHVILDLHAAPGGQGMDEGISDYDPDKPSLFESQANQDKMVALWRRIADRYADEPVIAGYDILNEPNWPLDSGELRSLYMDVTAAIREVDNRHIIFIEGNWFANDFTGLTPPWDDKLVYSPHKYWSVNDQASIQWVLDIRENFDVPLYLGESGENSNVWFRDAIRLFEDNNMGWAWWPMKKVESIAGPLSVTKTSEYNQLLNYWKGQGSQPSVAFATATLMQLTEDLKIENCTYQADVIDAMFRQVYSDETLPFSEHTIPGVIYASDYDYGREGYAYHDNESNNFQVTTGTFTSWNNGWIYRNDGVDLERSDDNINSNGIHVGWVEEDEWCQYSLASAEEGVYDVNIRYASAIGGVMHLATDRSAISTQIALPTTGAWDVFETITLTDVYITDQDDKLRWYADREGFNLSSLDFVRVGEINDVTTTFLEGITLDESTVELCFNKPLDANGILDIANFTITVNGIPITINTVEIIEGTRCVIVDLDIILNGEHIIRASYDGADLISIDGQAVEPFTQVLVKNTLDDLLFIPGRVEAEAFTIQEGMQLETTTDNGGGQNIGFLDEGDYAEYEVFVLQEGAYDVTYRHASEWATGGLQLFRKDGSQLTLINAEQFAPTGGWQSWQSTTSQVYLPQGDVILRLRISAPNFNLNYMDFELIASNTEEVAETDWQVYPNPTSGIINIQTTESYGTLEIRNQLGRLVWSRDNQSLLPTSIDVSHLTSGQYYLTLTTADAIGTVKVVLMN